MDEQGVRAQAAAIAAELEAKARRFKPLEGINCARCMTYYPKDTRNAVDALFCRGFCKREFCGQGVAGENAAMTWLNCPAAPSLSVWACSECTQLTPGRREERAGRGGAARQRSGEAGTGEVPGKAAPATSGRATAAAAAEGRIRSGFPTGFGQRGVGCPPRALRAERASIHGAHH